MRPTHTIRRASAVAVALLLLGAVGSLAAHDFWLVPNALSFLPTGEVVILGQGSTRFPTSSSATQPAQVSEARVVTASRDDRVTDLSVSGRSLRLAYKPSAAGQHVVAVALASRNARTTPERLRRYLAAEGAPELAERLAGDAALARFDSVTQTTAKFAKAVVEVGSGGARAFSKPVGHALELVPLRDPSRLHSGDTVSVRLLYRGRPVPNVHLRAGSASPDAVNAESAPADAPPDQVIVTGADGAALLRVDRAGLWNVRVLYTTSMAGMPAHWEMLFATLVFAVSDAH